MILCLFVCLCICFFCFNHGGTPTESFPENFVKIQLDLPEIFRIWKMFICLFVCLFVCSWICLFYAWIILGHPQKVSLKVSWRSELIWLRYSWYKNVYLFVCLFDLLFCFLIILGHLRDITLKIPWRSELIWLRYLWSNNMLICLFVCLFVHIFVCLLF